MEQIYETNDSFQFDKLTLSKPILVSGGNYFIRCLVNNSPLYIQPPKCSTKQGIVLAGKRYYTDLMFTNLNEDFIRWMENLENHCQQFIFKNREKWFDSDMEIHDIENYFTSPLKLYKSGKYYIARCNVASALGKPTLKIYDENEQEVESKTLTDKTNIMTILEIQGIKCSARSFQIELEVKQMMALKPSNLFEKCIIRPKAPLQGEDTVKPDNKEIDGPSDPTLAIMEEGTGDVVETVEEEKEKGKEEDMVNDEPGPALVISESSIDEAPATESEKPSETEEVLPKIDTTIESMEEVTFDLEELPVEDSIQLKRRNDVYYEMYREARRKAKESRDLALLSYLEAKRIKNTYMLDDIKDSDESDLDMDEEEDDNSSIEETDESK